MDRPYATAEQFERWFKKTCSRCGQHRLVQARWPDGPVCWTCHDRALLIRGQCPSCGENRVLPGLASDGTSLCTTCSGFRMSYACSRCGHEGKLHARRICTRCTFADQLTELLDDGSGQIRPELLPLFEALKGMGNPLTGLTWLYKPYTPRFLRGLASGEIALTHEAFHQLRPWRPAAHLREILMGCGLLPAIDKQLLLFERWLADHLSSIGETEHSSVVRQFAAWHILPRLRSQAKKQPLSPHTRRRAGAQVRRATEFLNWLAAQDLTPATCAQADLDRWHVDHRGHERHSVKGFLQWAMRSGHMSTLDIPRTENEQREPISQHRRIDLLRRLIIDEAPALRTRAAGVLLLLYAQPVSRIVRLTTSDVITQDDQVLIQFGSPPTPVPAPFASLLLELRDHRANMRTATNPNSQWLFPGRRAGQPLRPETISALLRQLDIPTTLGRTAAVQQLVLQAPAPVVAEALGFHPVTAHRHFTNAGGTWNRYAPAGHNQ